MEDQVIAVLHLREEQTMLAARLPAFLVGDERSERGQPLLAALEYIASGQRIGQFLQPCRVAAPRKCIAGLLEIDALFPHSNREPVMLIDADPRGKRKIGTHAYEHPAPARVIQVEVELIYPALLVLQV